MGDETSATIRVRDGRQLGYAEYGNPRGAPVMHFHGHPGSRLEAALLERAAQEVRVRVIGVDRPGMGLSTPLAKRRLLDWPDDVVDLADALGLERFAVEGISGGGPYAIACAAAIPERLTSCGIGAGVGPVADFGTAGMMRANRIPFFIARRLPGVLRPTFWLVLGRHRAAADDEVKLDALATQLVGSFPAVECHDPAVFVGAAKMDMGLGDAGNAHREVEPDLGAALLALSREGAGAIAGDRRHDLVSGELGVGEDFVAQRGLGPERRCRECRRGTEQDYDREGAGSEAGPALTRNACVLPSGKVNCAWASVRWLPRLAGCPCITDFSRGPYLILSTPTWSFSNSTA